MLGFNEKKEPATVAYHVLLMADKAREKLIAKVVKEGGKKGVEIDGAADMARCPGSPRHAAAVEPA